MIEIIPNWHPIFVHFTIALISISALCYFIGFLAEQYSFGKELLIVGRWCLWFAALAAIATVIAGFIAYYSVAHDTLSHEAMAIHRNWAIATLILIVIAATWSVWIHIQTGKGSFVFMLFMVIVFLLASITAWHGAELVYRYGLGVKSLPNTTTNHHESSHDHHHSD